MAYIPTVKIVRTRAFERSAKKLGASSDELAALEAEIAANPDAGDVIKGLNGARKIRFAMAGKGKRGGGRAIYVVIQVQDVSYLLLAYSKTAQEDLSPAQRRAVADVIERLTDGKE